MQTNLKTKDEQHGEHSFVVMSFQVERKERTKEAICTWLGRWESHFKLHPKPDSTKYA